MRAMRLIHTSSVTITATEVNSGFLPTLPATTDVPRIRTMPMPDARDDGAPAQVPPWRVLVGEDPDDEQERRRVDDERDEDAEHARHDRRAAPSRARRGSTTPRWPRPWSARAESSTANAMPAKPPSSRALPSTAFPPGRLGEHRPHRGAQGRHRRDRAEQQHDDRDDAGDGQPAAELEESGSIMPLRRHRCRRAPAGTR